MYRGSILHVSSWGRLALGLCLLVGLCLALGGQARPAHAQSTLTVTDCSSDSQLQADVTQANADNAGDTITFSCSGDIKLTAQITIKKNMTLDGGGQNVTLDGQGQVRALVVNQVTLNLNNLTLANGSGNASTGLLGGTSDGGGVYNFEGTVNITNSTFANNSSGGPGSSGGAIKNYEGTVNITNSTFVNNSGFAAAGAIENDGFGGSIKSSTFYNNSSGIYGSAISDKVSITPMMIVGSIVANNSGGNCSGSITDNGYNLESGTDCGFTGTGSLQSTNPQLDPSGLQNNGGPTRTIALLSSSPAIDRIPAANCPATDQRGATRPDAGEPTCDIGAYESDYPPDSDLGLTNLPANITADATSPQGAVVHYTLPTATDESGESSSASVSCTPASGSTFPIGTTKVTCTATDSDDANSPVSQSFTVTVNDTDLGLNNIPSNMTTDATSPQGAIVTYTSPTVVDEDSPLPTANCTPASGSTFPIGTTKVTCTATDSDDTPGSVSQSFTVTVKDVTPPTLSLPSSPITVDATSPAGASVTYTVTATDPDNAASDLTISCSPVSGSTFAIGTTTVNCSASDPAGNSSSGSFQVVVNGATTQVSSLTSLVNSMGLSSALQNSLDVKLNAALKAVKAGQTATACSDLSDFIGEAQSQSGKGLTTSQANQLIAAARQVQTVLGC